MTTILGLVLISSTAIADAAFTETTRCAEVGVDFPAQYVITVSNSTPDGYSHEIKLTKNGSTKAIASVNTGEDEYDGNMTMETQYGKFSVKVSGRNGVLTFDGDATVDPTSRNALNLRKATLKVKGLKNQSLLCVVN